jgi:hypothetical protein
MISSAKRGQEMAPEAPAAVPCIKIQLSQFIASVCNTQVGNRMETTLLSHTQKKKKNM